MRRKRLEVVALAHYFTGIVARVRGFSIDAAYINRQDPTKQYKSTYILLHLLFDGGTLAVIIALIPIIQSWYPDQPDLMLTLLAIGIANLFFGFSQIQETFIAKALRFKQIATVDLISSIMMTIVTITMAFLGFGLWALLAEQLVGALVRFSMVWGPFRDKGVGLAWDRQSLRELFDFGIHGWVFSNIHYQLDRFDDFWIGSRLGSGPLGIYAKAYEFARYPRRIFANPLLKILFPVFAKLQDDRERLSKTFFRTMFFLYRTGLVISGVLLLIIPEVVEVLIGEQWVSMILPFRLMLFYTLFDPLLMIIQNMFIAIGSPEIPRNGTYAQILVFVPAVIIGASLQGIAGVAVAANLMLVVGIVFHFRHVRRRLDFSLWQIGGWPTLTFIPLILMFWFLPFDAMGPWVRLILKASGFSFVFLPGPTCF